MADVFISYKREERQAVERLAQELRGLGLDVWFDARLSPGKAFTDEIVEEIDTCRAMLVCWSPNALASDYVRGEADLGRQRGVLVQVTIAPCRIVPPFNSLHAEALEDWLVQPTQAHSGWRKILRRIGALCGREDIESFGALDVQAPPSALRAWIERHQSSPLFMAVDELLRARDVEEAERARLEQEAHERREREEAARLAREEAERAERLRLETAARIRKEREEEQRAAEEAAHRAQEEAAQRAQQEAAQRAHSELLKRTKREEEERKGRDWEEFKRHRRVVIPLLVILLVASGGGVWWLANEITRGETRQEQRRSPAQTQIQRPRAQESRPDQAPVREPQAQPATDPCDEADAQWVSLRSSRHSARVAAFVENAPDSCNAHALARALLAELLQTPPVESRSSSVNAPANNFELTCSLLSNATPASLRTRYGAENVSAERVHIGEGQYYEATVLFASDPVRRLEFVWYENALWTIRVLGSSSTWVGPSGLRLGQTLQDVEYANAAPFTLTGWGWDLGGRAYNWGSGALSRERCRILVQFDRRGRPAPMGDSDFASNSVAVRNAEPVVVGLMLSPRD